MIADRKEPTISSASSTADDLAISQQRFSGPSDRQASFDNLPRSSPPSRPSILAVFAFLLALMAVAGVGFLYWHIQLAQQALEVATERISGLESRLSLADDEAMQSVATIEAKLKWADAEIRKLWGVSHDRNRKKIAANEDRLASAEKKLNGLTATFEEMKQAMETHKATLLLAKQELSASLTQHQEQFQEQLNTVIDSINLIEKQLQSDIVERLKHHESAIKSMDAYRLSTNRELLQLQDQLRKQQSPTP